MKSAVIIFLIGAAWAFPKGAEELQFKGLHVHPLDSIPEKISKIINGHEVVPHSIPSQAYLIITGLSGRWVCAGSLISPNYVLTAGHCVAGAFSAEVYLGCHNVQKVESTRLVITSDNLTVHEGFDNSTISNDIGLIKLPAPIALNEYINVIALPGRAGTDNIYEGRSARVSGWGFTRGGGNTSPVLMEVNSTVISNSDCNRYYGVVQNYQVCISGAGGVGSCNGDSGGPLVIDNKQVGIVSYGVFGCMPGYPSAFTRTDSFSDWIEEYTDLKF